MDEQGNQRCSGHDIERAFPDDSKYEANQWLHQARIGQDAEKQDREKEHDDDWRYGPDTAQNELCGSESESA